MAGKLQNPYKIAGLYTYGSPRAGDKAFVKSLDVEHFRCRNNNDLVTKVPFWLMGYRHHGKLVYINYYGNVRRLTPWQRFKDGWRGRFRAWSKFQFFDGAYDHSINEYERKLTNVVLSD
jgi:triacylglycerol lipase